MEVKTWKQALFLIFIASPMVFFVDLKWKIKRWIKDEKQI